MYKKIQNKIKEKYFKKNHKLKYGVDFNTVRSKLTTIIKLNI